MSGINETGNEDIETLDEEVARRKITVPPFEGHSYVATVPDTLDLAD